MAYNLTKIVITRPDFFDGEMDRINHLMESGLKLLHIRKPEATEEEMRAYILQINADYRNRLVLHSHFHLAHTYHLGGIHLSRNRQTIPPDFMGRLSYSCHTLEEVAIWKPRCCYVFLSPIFDSISKKGYHAAFTIETLEKAHKLGIVDHQVIALGGITQERIPLIESLGFGGVAMLGEVWENKANLSF